MPTVSNRTEAFLLLLIVRYRTYPWTVPLVALLVSIVICTYVPLTVPLCVSMRSIHRCIMPLYIPHDSSMTLMILVAQSPPSVQVRSVPHVAHPSTDADDSLAC